MNVSINTLIIKDHNATTSPFKQCISFRSLTWSGDNFKSAGEEVNTLLSLGKL